MPPYIVCFYIPGVVYMKTEEKVESKSFEEQIIDELRDLGCQLSVVGQGWLTERCASPTHNVKMSFSPHSYIIKPASDDLILIVRYSPEAVRAGCQPHITIRPDCSLVKDAARRTGKEYEIRHQVYKHND